MQVLFIYKVFIDAVIGKKGYFVHWFVFYGSIILSLVFYLKLLT